MTNKNKEKIFLNIINDKCPITFVKTKIALEKLKPNQFLEIHIREGEGLDGMPSSLEALGFKIMNKKLVADNIYSLKITK